MDRIIALEKAKALVAKMTLEEKAGQLRYDAPAIPRLGIPAYNWWNEALHGVARAGTATSFPQAIGMAAMFDDALLERLGDVAATEGRAKYNALSAEEDRDIYKGLTFWSPNINIFRDPRWGRVMESTGEDPHLNGLFAAAMVRGYQGRNNDLTEKGHIAACLKHFAGYGAPEGGRDYNTVELSERTLREDYLPAYKAAVDAGCALVMTSFNTLNRIPSTANRWLMQDVLREEMGFEGVLISDWAAVAELMIHGIAQDAPQAAELSMNAGVDIDMSTSVYIKNLKQLVEEGRITEEQIDEAALRVLTLKNKLGLFENPLKDGSEEDEKKLILCDAHRAAARESAEKSFVLLKNEQQFLPLKQEETVAFIGPYADNKLISGSWSIFGNDEDCVTVKEGICALYPNAKAVFAPGAHIVDPGVEIMSFQNQTSQDTIDPEAALAEALELAKKADKVVLLLGEHREYTGEGASRSDLTLPRCQIALLNRIREVNPKVAVVLFNGRPLDICEVESGSMAILEAWLPGTEGGNAVADILSGEFSIATRAGAHCAPRLHTALGTVEQGAVRFSFGYYNTTEDVDAAIAAVRSIAL